MQKHTENDVIVFGKSCSVDLMQYDKADGKRWKKLFDHWAILRKGMKDFESRAPNIPEGLSEAGFCMYTGSQRLISLRGESSSSFDTFNLKRGEAEQIKACSISRDLTSFGPTSKWDKLYFLDFYNDGKLDGTFDIYLIPNKLIYATSVNEVQLMSDQQIEKRRPRFSLKDEFVSTGKAKLVAKKVQVWNL